MVAALFAGTGIAVFSGLTDIPYLIHSQVPLATSPDLGRAGVALALGLGFGLAGAGIAHERGLSRAEGHATPTGDGHVAQPPAGPVGR
jgi:hypothetical protein